MAMLDYQNAVKISTFRPDFANLMKKSPCFPHFLYGLGLALEFFTVDAWCECGFWIIFDCQVVYPLNLNLFKSPTTHCCFKWCPFFIAVAPAELRRRQRGEPLDLAYCGLANRHRSCQRGGLFSYRRGGTFLTKSVSECFGMCVSCKPATCCQTTQKTGRSKNSLLC